MTVYRERFYGARDGLRLFYRDYPAPPGGEQRPPVLCLPGLTRNARDFEAVAARMARERRVLCADFRGRGRSAYDPDWRKYSIAVETDDVLALLADAGLADAGGTRTAILGTSRGGIVGMAMAGLCRDMLAGIILVDVGAVLDAAGLQRIFDMLRAPSRFADWDAAALAVKSANAALFPGVDDAHWLAHARAVFQEKDGAIVPDRDPALTDAAIAAMGPEGKAASLDLWSLFANLKGLPALVLRGANSDLLSAETLGLMRAAKPDLASVTVTDRGHVPFLDEPEAVTAIDRFLASLS